MILSNQAKCKLCGDTPWSANRHDYKHCKCGEISVDGGMEYVRRGANNLSNIEEMSIEMDDKLVKAICDDMEENQTRRTKNELGILCDIVRTLRDNGYEIKEVDSEA